MARRPRSFYGGLFFQPPEPVAAAARRTLQRRALHRPPLIGWCASSRAISATGRAQAGAATARAVKPRTDGAETPAAAESAPAAPPCCPMPRSTHSCASAADHNQATGHRRGTPPRASAGDGQAGTSRRLAWSRSLTGRHQGWSRDSPLAAVMAAAAPTARPAVERRWRGLSSRSGQGLRLSSSTV
jgi:hypothetical protein